LRERTARELAWDKRLLEKLLAGNLKSLIGYDEDELDNTGNIELRCWACAAGVRITAHHRTGCGPTDHVHQSRRDRQQRVVSAGHGALRHPSTPLGVSNARLPAIRWQPTHLRGDLQFV
jgi:hypothetical protein